MTENHDGGIGWYFMRKDWRGFEMRELEISAEISTMRTLTEAFTINNKTALKKTS